MYRSMKDHMSKSSLSTSVLILIFAVLLCSMPSPAEVQKKSSFELIDEAFVSGQITETQKLMASMTALFAPDKLDPKYVSSTVVPMKSGTELVLAVRDRWDDFSDAEQSLLTQYLARPSSDTSLTSPTGHFRIHYDTLGIEPVPLQDLNFNHVPDFIERTASYLDSAYGVYIDQMGHYPPPIDTTGGNIAYDIYMVAILSYGITIPEYPADSAWNDYTSYIQLHNTFYGFPPNDDPEGDTIGAQKVTCAHEFYHAVQLGYDYDLANNLWWMEAGATYMEEIIFPEVNDNFIYLPYMYNQPHKALSSNDAYHMYGAFVWPLYMRYKFDATIMKNSWLACRNNLPVAAIDSALKPYGKSVAKIFSEFTLWNYFTGARNVPGEYFPDAAAYPLAPFDQSLSSLIHDSIQPVTRPDGLGCNYIEYTVDSTARGILEIKLEGNSSVRWGLAAVYEAGSFDTTLTTLAPWSSSASLYLPFIEDYDRVIAIPSVVTSYQTSNNYFLSTIIIPYGDANYDGEVNVGDAVYILSYAFRNGPAPIPIQESGDANCDGFSNVADAVKIISFVFRDGLPPCSERP